MTVGLAVVVVEEGEGGEAVAIVVFLRVIGDVVSDFRIMDGRLKVDQREEVVGDGRRISFLIQSFFCFGGSRARLVY